MYLAFKRGQITQAQRLAVDEIDRPTRTPRAICSSMCCAGAHFRDDFPKRLDETWMKHTLAWADDSTTKVHVDYRPVHTRTLTNDVKYFPPQEQIR